MVVEWGQRKLLSDSQSSTFLFGCVTPDQKSRIILTHEELDWSAFRFDYRGHINELMSSFFNVSLLIL